LDVSWADAAKARKLRHFFQKHGRVYIVVDADSDDVRVPESIKGDPALRLVLNVRMPQSVHILDHALESDFSFSGKVFPCHIPMRRIWAAYVPEQAPGAGILWENDMPAAVRTVVSAVRTLEKNGSHVAGHKGVSDQAGGSCVSSAKSPSGKRRHLRVVK